MIMSRPPLGNRLSLIFTGLVTLALLAWPVVAPMRAAAAPAAQEGQAVITSPPSNTPVVGTIQVTGTAVHPQFVRYELAWSPEPITGDAWAVFATIETPIENGVLGTWNTAQTPDGLYALRLRVVRQDGNYSEAFVRGLSVANNRPVETPTSPIGPTIPPEPSQEPVTPSPELIVQPPTSTPQPPTPTPAPSSESTTDTIGRLNPTSFNINLGALSQAFCTGVTYTFGLFFLWGAVLSVRGVARWIVHRIQRPPAGDFQEAQDSRQAAPGA
jgi:hypothetical protein